MKHIIILMLLLTTMVTKGQEVFYLVDTVQYSISNTDQKHKNEETVLVKINEARTSLYFIKEDVQYHFWIEDFRNTNDMYSVFDYIELIDSNSNRLVMQMFKDDKNEIYLLFKYNDVKVSETYGFDIIIMRIKDVI